MLPDDTHDRLSFQGEAKQHVHHTIGTQYKKSTKDDVISSEAGAKDNWQQSLPFHLAADSL